MSEISQVAKEIGELVEQKNHSYGDSIGISRRILELLSPSGVEIWHYDDLHFIVRIIDKLSRIMSGHVPLDRKTDAWKDIAGYALLRLVQLKDEPTGE